MVCGVFDVDVITITIVVFLGFFKKNHSHNCHYHCYNNCHYYYHYEIIIIVTPRFFCVHISILIISQNFFFLKQRGRVIESLSAPHFFRAGRQKFWVPATASFPKFC